MATDAERYQFLRQHFSRLMITNQQVKGENHIKCIDIAAERPSANPESVDAAVDDAMENYPG